MFVRLVLCGCPEWSAADRNLRQIPGEPIKSSQCAQRSPELTIRFTERFYCSGGTNALNAKAVLASRNVKFKAGVPVKMELYVIRERPFSRAVKTFNESDGDTLASGNCQQKSTTGCERPITDAL